MTPEERAEIRALAEIPAEKLTLAFEFYYRRDVPRLLAALDVCEAERDAARAIGTEVAKRWRAAEAERDRAVELLRDLSFDYGDFSPELVRIRAFLASVATEESNG